MGAGAEAGDEPGLTGSVWRAPQGPLAPAPSSRLLTPAIVASLALLLASAVTSISWAVGQGGVALPARSTAPAAAASVAPVPTGMPGGAAGTIAPSRTPAATSAPTAAPAGASPAAILSPRPIPTSDRYALLTACPGTPDCYRYTVRAGDNLWSIARWFGVPLQTVYDRNPDLRTTTLLRGMQIILPAPTR